MLAMGMLREDNNNLLTQLQPKNSTKSNASHYRRPVHPSKGVPRFVINASALRATRASAGAIRASGTTHADMSAEKIALAEDSGIVLFSLLSGRSLVSNVRQ